MHGTNMKITKPKFMLHFKSHLINTSTQVAYDQKPKNTRILIIITIGIYTWNQRMENVAASNTIKDQLRRNQRIVLSYFTQNRSGNITMSYRLTINFYLTPESILTPIRPWTKLLSWMHAYRYSIWYNTNVQQSYTKFT